MGVCVHSSGDVWVFVSGSLPVCVSLCFINYSQMQLHTGGLYITHFQTATLMPILFTQDPLAPVCVCVCLCVHVCLQHLVFDGA